MVPSSNSSDTALKWHWEILSRSDWTECRVIYIKMMGEDWHHMKYRIQPIVIGMWAW